MLLLTITASLSVLAQTGASVVEAVGASVEIFAVIDRAPAIPNDWASKSDDDRATELRLARGDAAGCSFEDVVFSYASRPDLRVLDGLTLRIPAKSRAALGCVEIEFRAPHAIDATLSPWPRRLDGVEAHEGPDKISTQRATVRAVEVVARLDHVDHVGALDASENIHDALPTVARRVSYRHVAVAQEQSVCPLGRRRVHRCQMIGEQYF